MLPGLAIVIVRGAPQLEEYSRTPYAQHIIVLPTHRQVSQLVIDRAHNEGIEAVAYVDVGRWLAARGVRINTDWMVASGGHSFVQVCVECQGLRLARSRDIQCNRNKRSIIDVYAPSLGRRFEPKLPVIVAFENR